MSSTVQLRDPTFAESLAIESYKAAASGALAASDSFADKVVAAAFSAGTVYGAVIALVAPKNSQSPILVALPFGAFVMTAAVALYAQSIGIDLSGTNDLDVIRRRVSSTISHKRCWGRVALISLILGVAGGILIVRATYASGAQKHPKSHVTVFLTPAGGDFVQEACGSRRPLESISGEMATEASPSTPLIGLDVDRSSCRHGAGTLFIPQRFISILDQAAPGT